MQQEAAPLTVEETGNRAEPVQGNRMRCAPKRHSLVMPDLAAEIEFATWTIDEQ